MLNDPKLRQEAYQYFLEEAPELLKTVERNILALKPKGQHFTKRREHAYEVMRATHTLKGNAATFDLKMIKTIAHTFEDLIKGLYNSEVVITEALKQLLMQAYGCLSLAYDKEIKGRKLDEQYLMEHTALIFSQLQSILGNDFSDLAIPNSTDMGFDYVESVFTTGVVQRIKDLELFLKQKAGEAANPEILMILHSHLEVLSDLGLSLNLSGFSEIAHLGDQALAAAPKHWEVIMGVVLEDFEHGAAMIRQGDRQRGGEPSQVLVAWAKQAQEVHHTAESPNQVEQLLDTLEDLVTHRATDHELPHHHDAQKLDPIDSLLDSYPRLPHQTSTVPSANSQALPIIPVPVTQAVEQALQRLETYTSSHHTIPQLTLSEMALSEMALSEVDLSERGNFNHPNANQIKAERTKIDHTNPSSAKNKPPKLPQPSITELNYNLAHNFVDPSADLEHLFDDLDSANVTNLDRYVVAPEIALSESTDLPHLNDAPMPLTSDSNHDYIIPIDITPIATDVTQVPDVDTIDLLATFSTNLEDILSDFNIAEDKTTIDWLSGVFEPSPEPKQSYPEITPSMIQTLSDVLSDDITAQIKAEVIQQVTQEVIEQIRAGRQSSLENTAISTVDLHTQPLLDQMLSHDSVYPVEPHLSHFPETKSAEIGTGNLSAVRVDLEVLERLQHNISEIWINQHQETNNLGELQQSIWELSHTHQRLRETLKELARLGITHLMSPETATAPIAKLENQYGQFQTLLHQALQDMAQLDQSTTLLDQVTQESQMRLEQQQKRLDYIRNDLVSARMQSLGAVLQRCYYVVDQLCQRYQKSVQLNIYGTDILIDKAVAEKLYDPLLHLLRNAFDHGIEPANIRSDLGKQAAGTINIIAQQRGGQITLEICDDGQGINYEAVRQKAISLGLVTPDSIDQLSLDELTEFLFEPGFSTAKEVSDLSGRGIGLDVVRVQLQNINGSIMVKSLPHQGTSFTLRFPVSLTVARLMLVKAGQIVYALLADGIDQVIMPKSNQINVVADQKLLQLHDSDTRISVINLASVMEYHSVIAHNRGKHEDRAFHSQTYAPVPHLLTGFAASRQGTVMIQDDLHTGRMAIPAEIPVAKALGTDIEMTDIPTPVVIVRYQTQLMGLEVEQVLGDVETLIRPLGNEFTSPSYIYGCCVLGNGQAYLVVDAVTLMGEIADPDGTQGWLSDSRENAHTQKAYAQTTYGQRTYSQRAYSQRAYLEEPEVTVTNPNMPALAAGTSRSSDEQDQPRRILVVDDSVSQRKILKSLMEKHGFAVVLAKDGKDAVQQLNQNQGNLCLAICDVEMPRMNGFEFLSYCRQSSLWRSLPMIMLTSRTSGKHRNVAMELGAQEYITKPFNEKTLVDLIHQLV